jgi:hypothetical protein
MAGDTDRRVMGSLERSMAALTIGTVKAREARSAMLDPISASNMIQYRQVPISGHVGKTPIVSEIVVDWPYPFTVAPAQTDADAERPHFAVGVELLSTQTVMIVVQLLHWNDSADGWTESATLRVTAWVPEAKKKHDFNAILHLTFSGYGVPDEGDTDDTGEDLDDE